MSAITEAATQSVTIRRFRREDQAACVSMFSKGLKSYARPGDDMEKLQDWFVASKVDEGGDMYDIYTSFECGRHDEIEGGAAITTVRPPFTEVGELSSEPEPQSDDLHREEPTSSATLLSDVSLSGSPSALTRCFWVAVCPGSDEHGPSGQEEIVGCVGCYPSTKFADDLSTLELVRMSVKEGTRRLGIGSKLIKHVEDYARSIGKTRINLSTLAAMGQAVALYTRNGYTELERQDIAIDTLGLSNPVITVVHFVKEL
jgi:ribosomal protein S18 acetylase RimI-like enzyme